MDDALIDIGSFEPVVFELFARHRAGVFAAHVGTRAARVWIKSDAKMKENLGLAVLLQHNVFDETGDPNTPGPTDDPAYNQATGEGDLTLAATSSLLKQVHRLTVPWTMALLHDDRGRGWAFSCYPGDERVVCAGLTAAIIRTVLPLAVADYPGDAAKQYPQFVGMLDKSLDASYPMRTWSLGIARMIEWASLEPNFGERLPPPKHEGFEGL